MGREVLGDTGAVSIIHSGQRRGLPAPVDVKRARSRCNVDIRYPSPSVAEVVIRPAGADTTYGTALTAERCWKNWYLEVVRRAPGHSCCRER